MTPESYEEDEGPGLFFSREFWLAGLLCVVVWLCVYGVAYWLSGVLK